MASVESMDQPSTASTSENVGWRTDLYALLALALPNVMSMVAETSMSFVDFLIVSQLGSAAQAAVSSSAIIYFTAFGFLIGTMECVTTMVSQSLGARHLRACSAYAWQGVALSLVIGTVGIGLYPVLPDLFALIGHDPEVQQMESAYAQIRFLGMGLAGASIALGGFFNGIHQPRHNTYSVIATNVLNVALSYALVTGAWGMPRMGVAGAALGSVISLAVRVAWLTVVMCTGERNARFASRRMCAIDLDKAWRLLKVGVPSGVQFVSEIAGWAVLLVVIIGQFGNAHMAACAICLRYCELSFMPNVGIGLAVMTMVGKAIGEGSVRLARRRAVLGAALGISYMGTMGLIMILARRPLIGVFSEEPVVVAIGMQMMIFAAVFQIFDATAMNYSSALRGAGDTLWTAVVGAVLSWGCMVGGGATIAALKPEWGGVGPWMFGTVFIITASVLFLLRWRSGRWEKLDVIGRHRSPALAAEADTDTEAADTEAAGTDDRSA